MVPSFLLYYQICYYHIITAQKSIATMLFLALQHTQQKDDFSYPFYVKSFLCFSKADAKGLSSSMPFLNTFFQCRGLYRYLALPLINQLAKKIRQMWTEKCGGNKGSYSVQVFDPYYSLVGITLTSASFVNSMRFYFMDIRSGRPIVTNVFGRQTSNQQRKWVGSSKNPGTIERIIVYSGDFVDSIQIIGRSAPNSEKIGGSGGNFHSLDINGRRICGVALRYGDNIDQISFAYA